MRFKLKVMLLCASFLIPATIGAQVPTGRWEIVHTSGDNAAQTALYPGGFSTVLLPGGTGSAYATYTNSICVIDDEGSNVVPSWTTSDGINFQITITINNLGVAPNVSFVYTGAYAVIPIPGDTSVSIPQMTGTFVTVGDASACSSATTDSPGTFVATFLPTLSSGSTSGSLDAMTTDGGTPFDATVNATVSFTTPPSEAQISGTVSLDSNPTFNTNACFATTSGAVNPLTINTNLSQQSGISEAIYAEGFDPNGVPTTLVLRGYSANLYTTDTNTDPTANQITSTEWAAGAAIGEDNPAAGSSGVGNDGTNNVMVFFYDVVGGSCDTAGGTDAPFHFLSGKSIPHGHRKHYPRGKRRLVHSF